MAVMQTAKKRAIQNSSKALLPVGLATVAAAAAPLLPTTLPPPAGLHNCPAAVAQTVGSPRPLPKIGPGAGGPKLPRRGNMPRTAAEARAMNFKVGLNTR